MSVLSHPGFWFAATALAVGMSLAWALRGSAPGTPAPSEEDGASPGARHRDRALFLAVLGAVLAAGGAFVAGSASIPWSIPLFASGFGLEWFVARENRPYRHSSPSLRRIVRFSETALTASLLLGILVVGNLAAFRYGERPIDFTRERVFSLESLTIRQLQALDRPIRLIAFFDRGTVRQADRLRQLLELYRAENPSMVRTEVLPLNADPIRTEEFLKAFPDAEMARGGVAIESGEGPLPDRVIVRNAEIFDAAPSTEPGRFEVVFRGEDAVTSALIRLREGKKAKFAMTTGHGETPAVASAANRPSVSRLKARLEGSGAEVTEADLARGPIADDVEVALIIAPRTAFSAEEIGRLSAFARRGGRLVVLLDGRKASGLDEWLKASNLDVGPGVVVDVSSRFATNPSVVPVTVPPSVRNPIVAPLANLRVVVPNAAPLIVRTPGMNPPPLPGIQVAPILSTGREAWSETDLSGPAPVFDPKTDRPGPIVVAAAVQEVPSARGQAPTPRMVVFSSPDLADDYFVGQFEANLDLVVNAVQWLRGRPDLQGLAPRRREVPRFDADYGLQARLVAVPTLLALGTIVALGVSTFLARRR